MKNTENIKDNHKKQTQPKNQGEQFACDTSNRSVGTWVKALIILFIGLAIAHLGVTLFLLSDLGTDTFTVFAQGLARKAGWTVGMMQMTTVCVLMIIMLFTTKGYVKPGTVVCAVCGGPIIDFFTMLLGNFINADSSMVVRVMSVVAGCIILALGMSIVINSNAGTGPNDLVAIILSDKINQVKKVEFRWVRMACDVVFVVLGFLLGGTVGAGTIVAVFLTGPTVQFWLPKTKKIIRGILHE